MRVPTLLPCGLQVYSGDRKGGDAEGVRQLARLNQSLDILQRPHVNFNQFERVRRGLARLRAPGCYGDVAMSRIEGRVRHQRTEHFDRLRLEAGLFTKFPDGGLFGGLSLLHDPARYLQHHLT